MRLAKAKIKFLLKFVLPVACLLLYCEWIIYYQVLSQCNWPILNPKNEESNISTNGELPLKLMVLTDLHLLGSNKTSWIEKVLRQWEMYRAFQTAVTLHKPEHIFILGDLTDEGNLCSDEEFTYNVKRFHSLFSVSEDIKVHLLVGNHDIGFHNETTPHLLKRFEEGFSKAIAELLTIRGNHFVIINSIGLDGDDCFLCSAVEKELANIEEALKCSRNDPLYKCKSKRKLNSYSRPILFQHFPLYRVSDEHCNEPDEAPLSTKLEKCREAWDVLSQNVSTKLLGRIDPRLVMAGHTHHGCTTKLENGRGVEITIPSFNWKHKNNPSYNLCDWPNLEIQNEDPSIRSHDEPPVRVMVLADTHLLGSRQGHWWDKLRREWQMYRTFQSAVTLHKPDLIFVLGDLTDEGLWCSEEEFRYYTRRFHSLFAIPNTTTMYVTVGNHDIGFHHRITPYLNQRFVEGFNSSAVQLISVRGNHFVLVNSMALEGDGCFLCRAAELDLVKIQKTLKCAKSETNKGCDTKTTKLHLFSRPILMQHFPMYRISDEDCHEPDEAPFPLKIQKYREGIDCLTKAATSQLLEQVNPRLVLAGHTHHGCTKKLPNKKDVEISIASFSWRNKNNPSYGLFVFTPNNYAFSKCLMPQESTVINTYILGALIIIIWLLYSMYNISRKRKYKYH